jgi:xanthine dehydrogenase/oxidase
VPDNDPVLTDPQYRKSLAMSLFYKFVLYANFETIEPSFKSAIESVIDSRVVSSGKQDYSVNADTFPVTKPMSKKNSILQASGEAEYVLDIPSLNNELHAAFIISTVGNCFVDQIDTTDALSVPGVVKLIFAQDLKDNKFKNSIVSGNTEILFSEGFVDFAGQAIGLVVADKFETATKAAKLVKVSYRDRKKPVLSINDAIATQNIQNVEEVNYGDADGALSSAPNVIQGECLIDTQFHFYMESQVALCQQNEEGVDVYSSTQWVDFLQNAVVNALGLPNASSVNVKVKQLGGGYGGNLSNLYILDYIYKLN